MSSVGHLSRALVFSYCLTVDCTVCEDRQPHSSLIPNLSCFFCLGSQCHHGPDKVVLIPQVEAAERASAAFQSVFKSRTKIKLDHHVVYFACKCSRLSSLHLL